MKEILRTKFFFLRYKANVCTKLQNIYFIQNCANFITLKLKTIFLVQNKYF